jgi:hypothetical protein
MMAAGPPSQLALAPNDNASPAALLEDLPSGAVEIQFQHGCL